MLSLKEEERRRKMDINFLIPEVSVLKKLYDQVREILAGFRETPHI